MKTKIKMFIATPFILIDYALFNLFSERKTMKEIVSMYDNFFCNGEFFNCK